MSATSQRLAVGPVTLDGLFAKVIVAADRTLNLAEVVKPARAGQPVAGAARAPSPPYRADVDRVELCDGSVDFAGLSLALPFAARVHGLTGSVVGLRSEGTAPAEVELEGQVDDHGLARVTGQLRPFDPTACMDLNVVFRNVEMPTLTPYSATFAGRRIDAGRLSLDLQYALRDRRLQGNNRVLIEWMVLGERVDSPDAINLPLGLAVALLQDADGRIDVGLPVTGSVDDPQFSVGQLVWKAVVNLLTRIVTAPFRALATLLGGEDQTLERIVFDPGASVLLPPQREKPLQMAEALSRRPALALTLDPAVDRLLPRARS